MIDHYTVHQKKGAASVQCSDKEEMESRKAKSRRAVDDRHHHEAVEGIEVDPNSIQVIAGETPFALDVSDITHDDVNRHYDLTPLNRSNNTARNRTRRNEDGKSFSIDPWEVKSPEGEEDENGDLLHPKGKTKR